VSSTAGRGHVERLGRNWYLRTWLKAIDADTGEIRRKQHREPIGRVSEIRTKAKARAIADAWLARQSPATLQPGTAVTFTEYAEKFLAEHVARLRPSSRRRYIGCVRQLQRVLASETLDNVDAARLQLVIVDLSDGRAVSTVRTLRSVALMILRRARSQKFGAHVVEARDVKLPRNSRPARERRSFTRDELERIVSASFGMWRALWAVMGYAGLRAGEALALTWADVDTAGRTIRVRANVTREGVQAPKTAGSAAHVQLLPRLEQLLQEYRPSWRANDQGLLFASRSGRPLSADNVRKRQLAKTLHLAGIRHAGLHAFRHSTPAILESLGLGAELIRRFMRHASLAQTAQYLHSNDVDVRAAIDAAMARRAYACTDKQPSAQVAQP